MSKKITASLIRNLTKNLLVDNLIPEIKKKDTNEFKIGNNFFYEMKNEKIQHIQRIINIIFQKNIPLNNSAIAFRKNLSYLHLFEPHRKNYYFLRLDIKSFFHSIEMNYLKEGLEIYFDEKDKYINKEKKQTALDGCINLITYKIPNDSLNEKFKNQQVVPMGFITSPVISNIIFRKIDIQIQKLCAQHNITYTRYADDMLFSSNNKNNFVHSENFEKEIIIIINQMNFKLNSHKTVKKKHTISLNGYTIEYSKKEKVFLKIYQEKLINEFRLSNKKIYIIYKLIHMIEKENKSPQYILKKLFNYKLSTQVPSSKKTKYETEQLQNKIAGYRSYILSFINFDKKYNCLQNNTRKKYINIIETLNKIIDKYNKN